MVSTMVHLMLTLAAVISCAAISLAVTTSHTLRKQFDSSGAPVCSVDPPSDGRPMSGGSVPCCSSCSTSSMCLYCQYKADMEQCELYNDVPQNYAVIDQCIGFQLLISCLSGWVQGGNRCYKLANGHFAGWQQAADFCPSLNPSQQSHLITIDSDEKQLMIAGLVAQFMPASSSAIPVSSSANVARNKTAWGSSYRSDYYGTNTASSAVDGSRATDAFQLQCFVSESGDNNPWFAVDLGSLTNVFGVALTNRDRWDFSKYVVMSSDAGTKSLHNVVTASDLTYAKFDLKIIFESFVQAYFLEYREDNFIVGLTNNAPLTMPPSTNGYTKCGQWSGTAPASATMFVQCAVDSPPARYVTILQAPPPQAYLQICELEVYTKSVLSPFHVNLALGRPTMQSSTYGSAISYLGVDGNNDTNFYHGSCAVTGGGETSPWWAVDLGSPIDIYGVDFTNRGDLFAERMDNFIVALTNNPPSPTSPPTSNYARCDQWPGAASGGQTLFVRCADNSPAARYVAILGQQPGNPVQICEVAVYGKVYAWMSGKWMDSLGSTNSNTNSFVWIDYPNIPQFMAYNYSIWELGKSYPNANNSCLAMNGASGAWRSVACQSWNPSLFYAVCEIANT